MQTDRLQVSDDASQRDPATTDGELQIDVTSSHSGKARLVISGALSWDLALRIARLLSENDSAERSASLPDRKRA